VSFVERITWTLGACCAGAFVIWVSGAALWGYVLSAVIIGCVTLLLVPRLEARHEQRRAGDLSAARGLWHP
jgi:Mg2+/citrate symporter